MELYAVSPRQDLLETSPAMFLSVTQPWESDGMLDTTVTLAFCDPGTLSRCEPSIHFK